MAIDYERLRQELIAIDLQFFAALGCLPSFIEDIDLERASDEELEDYALRCGYDLSRYEKE